MQDTGEATFHGWIEGGIRMRSVAFWRGREGGWNTAIIISSIVVFLANLVAFMGQTPIILSPLLSIPVVIAAYRYPKKGPLFGALVGAVYFMMVLSMTRSIWGPVVEAMVLTGVLILIGWLVAFLSTRLREQERLYRGIFDNSEAGIFLIREEDSGRIVESANEKSSSLLGMRSGEIEGKPLSLFWAGEEEESIFSRMADEGRVAAAETLFTQAEGGELVVLLSLAPLPQRRTILTFVNITRRVNAERALQTANDKLSLLSRIANDHLHKTVNEIIETVDTAVEEAADQKPLGDVLAKIHRLAWSLARQLFLTETYQDLGAAPPAWIPVQRILEPLGRSGSNGEVSCRFWTERLEVFADPLFREVLTHLVDNSLRHGGNLKKIVVTYHHTDEGLDILVEDDGAGIPRGKKEQIFAYDSGKHAGLGLFICRQILGVSGMTIVENGTEGEGARFVIHVPPGNYRIEGSGEDAPPFLVPGNSGSKDMGGVFHRSGTLVRELISVEFPLADTLWIDYHETKGDPRTDRIFAAFAGGEAVSLARCRRHPDGYEVDAVFTPERFRGHGYANAAVWALVEACGHDTLSMHSVVNITGFYSHFGFRPIPEGELPDSIRERFAWANGEMQGANVCPMRRDAENH